MSFGDQPHVLQQPVLLGTHSSCAQTLQPPIEPDVLIHSQPEAVYKRQWGRYHGRQGPREHPAHPLPCPRPMETHRSKSTLYCGQTPRQGRMAAMLVRTSWPRTEAEPAVGGKRPLRMDLQVQGSQGSFRGEAQAPRAEAPAFIGHLLYAQIKGVICSHFTGEGRRSSEKIFITCLLWIQSELRGRSKGNWGWGTVGGASGSPLTIQIGTF